MYRLVLGCSWPLVIMGPRKLGPTSGVGQCLTMHVSKDAKEWSDIDHQDVLRCPRQHSEGDETSDIGDSNNRAGPREVGPRPHTNYQLGRNLDHEGFMRVVWMTHSGVTRVKNHWKRYDLWGSRSRSKLHAWHVNN